MIRIWKYTIPLLAAAAWSCGKPSETERPKIPADGTQPIVWDVVSVDKPGSRSLVGPATDDQGNPYVDPDWETLEQACTPASSGGSGKAIGIWADYSYTDTDGQESTAENIFEGTRLIFAPKEGGNPHSNWNYEGEDLYWFPGGRYKFRAYFPQELEGNVVPSTNASTFVIEYPTHKIQEDLLVAYNEVDTADPLTDLNDPVLLRFRHGLAAIRFFIKADYANTDYLTSCYLQNAETRDFATSGMLAYGAETDPEQLSWVMGYNPPVTEKFYYWSNSGIEFSTDESGNALRAQAYTAAGTAEGDLFTHNDGWLLILPQASSGNLQFGFTTRNAGDTPYTVTIPQVTEQVEHSDGTITRSTEYLPGKRYTYTVTITETTVELTLTVADWNERESSYDIIF